MVRDLKWTNRRNNSSANVVKSVLSSYVISEVEKMTKECKQCQKEIADQYIYCLNCLQAFRANQDQTPQDKKSTGQWNEDPKIDQLMKINANLGNIFRILEEIADTMESYRTDKAIENGFHALIEELVLYHRGKE